jgi:GMP synthase (glutamine-hydrolysing)
MKTLCIQHVDFETPGVIEEWARHKNYPFQIIKPYQGDILPDIAEFDFIISMGGPQSPRDADHLAYLKAEINLLKKAVDSNKHVLGFCLGAQLIGEALGGKTLKSPEKEVGVYPITLTPEGQKDPLFHDFPSSFPVIHWHNDMPGSTQTSVLLASSEGCPIQAYRYAPRAYGLQFHMEITGKGIEDLIFHVPNDLSPSNFTQSKEDLLQNNYDAINQQMRVLLDRFVRL